MRKKERLIKSFMELNARLDKPSYGERSDMRLYYRTTAEAFASRHMRTTQLKNRRLPAGKLNAYVEGTFDLPDPAFRPHGYSRAVMLASGRRVTMTAE